MLAVTLAPPLVTKKYRKNGVIRSVYFAVSATRHDAKLHDPLYPVAPTVLLSPEVLPGMTNRSTNWTQSERSTLVVDLAALVAPTGPKAGRLVPLIQSLHSYKTRTTTRNGTAVTPESLDALPHALGAEIQIAVMALTPVQLAFGGDQVGIGRIIDTESAVPVTKVTQSHFEIQLGYANISVLDLVGHFVLQARKSFQVPVTGNNSNALKFLAASPALTVTGKLLEPFPGADTEAWAKVWHGLETRHGAALQKVIRPGWEQWYKLVNATMDQYKAVFVDYNTASAFRSNVDGLRAAAKSNPGKVYPHFSNLTRYHVQAWDYYAFQDTSGSLAAQLQPSASSFPRVAEVLRLPIWYYNRPAPKLPSPTATEPESLLLSKQRDFVRTVFQHALIAHGIGPTDSAVGLITGALEAALTSAPSENRRALLNAYLLEVVPFALVLPALCGKYRSDIAPASEYDVGADDVLQVEPSESCDCNRILGQSCSDDCEGCEACTREVYYMLRSWLPGATTSASSLDQLICQTARFLYTHYDYISLSGATTAASPGLDLQKEVADYDPRAVARDPRSKSALLRAKMTYGSAEDNASRSGFHQYSALIPVQVLAHLTRGTEHPVAASYYKQRSAMVSAEANAVLPGILLESTAPVSSAFLGIAYLSSLGKGGKQAPLSEFLQTVALLDQEAALDAIPLKQLARRTLNAGLAQVDDIRHKDTHVLRMQATIDTVPVPNRYTNTFYRQVCHGINVGMLIAESGLSKIHGFNKTGAASYLTFINNDSGGFGVPLERLMAPALIECADSAVFPFLRHPDPQVSESVFQTLDKLDAQLHISSRLPRSLFGTAHNLQPGILASSPSSNVAQQQSNDLSVVSRIMSSRVFIFKNLPLDQSVVTTQPMVNVARNQLARGEKSASPTRPVVATTLELFPGVFGQPITVVSM